MPQFKIFCADCLELLPKIKEDSIDAIVCDPPYELHFMGKPWDATGIAYNIEVWQQCLRVLKPGGHLLAFGGTRTYHRLACAIEDAGFKIRDMIEWVYGSGFPKSLNIGKAIDKLQGNEREIIGKKKGQGNIPNDRGKWGLRPNEDVVIDKGISKWEGWGTALKPAHEPICVARKSLEGTVAENVLKYGTGGINVDACRVGTEQTITRRNGDSGGNGAYGRDERIFERVNPPGRWPANLVHDGSDEVMAGFPESDGCQPHRINSRNNKYEGWGSITNKHGETVGYDGVGSAARFFYCAKASRGEREKGLKGILPCVNCGQLDSDTHIDEKRKKEVKCIRNPHPTVKPISLMRWLCSLVCPPNGIILDPFVGSGTTGIAAILENFKFLGIDKDEGYVKIAEVRIALAEKGMSYE